MIRKERSERFGRLAETACAVVLRIKGYTVLARRYRTPVGEIDIVARRGGVVAYIEVKARSGPAEFTGGEVSARQRHRIRRAAEHFLKRRPDLAALDHRFDVMLVRPWSLPTHLIDAWRD